MMESKEVVRLKMHSLENRKWKGSKHDRDEIKIKEIKWGQTMTLDKWHKA